MILFGTVGSLTYSSFNSFNLSCSSESFCEAAIENPILAKDMTTLATPKTLPAFPNRFIHLPPFEAINKNQIELLNAINDVWRRE